MPVQHETQRRLPDIDEAATAYAKGRYVQLPDLATNPAAWAGRVAQQTQELFAFRAGYRAGVADTLLAQATDPEEGAHWRAGYDQGRRAANPLI